MVALSVYLLIRTDYFGNKKYSALFGLSVGLGMLTKWTYFIFLGGLFLFYFLNSFGNLMREIIKADFISRMLLYPYLSPLLFPLSGMFQMGGCCYKAFGAFCGFKGNNGYKVSAAGRNHWTLGYI